MTDVRRRLTRRDFLRLAGMNLVAAGLPRFGLLAALQPPALPGLRLEDLPERMAAILSRVPDVLMTAQGALLLRDAGGQVRGRLPLRPTAWNLEHSRPYEKLTTKAPWGIVLHWFGDKDDFVGTIDAYLRGFDGLRKVGGELTRTSAHFLIGPGEPTPSAMRRGEQVAIVQTQAAAADGTPYIAAHIQGVDYQAYQEHTHYFANALLRMRQADPGLQNLLLDLCAQPGIEPNQRTIGIEISGHSFDQPGRTPPDQQIANVIGVIWALMARYRIPASNLLGHHEIQLGKADPGKGFMALMRCLIGVKALLAQDAEMWALVFGPFLQDGSQPWQAVKAYFQFARRYLVLTSTPRQVYAWEANSQFWFLDDRLPGEPRTLQAATGLLAPLVERTFRLGDTYLVPGGHEGIDIHPDRLAGGGTPVHLVAPGRCLFVGRMGGFHSGDTAIFRHRQADGAEFLSVYGNLDGASPIRPGQDYPAGDVVGGIGARGGARADFVHLALAYGAAWETDLEGRAVIPLNAGEAWIRERFMDPLAVDSLPGKPPPSLPLRRVRPG
jgi:hypothetical protein